MVQQRIARASVSVFLSRMLVAIFAVTLLPIMLPAGAPAQNRPPAPSGPPPDTSYLSGMPSVDTVKRLIQGSDATDTLERQAAVFNQLAILVQRMGLVPGRRPGDRTPQEYAQTNMYDAAATQTITDYGKTHTPNEVKAFFDLENKYQDDRSLRTEMFQKLFTSAFLDPYAKVAQADQAAYQANLNQQRAQNAPSQSPQNPFLALVQPSPNASQSGLSKDETRCLELGGSKSNCLGGSARGLVQGLTNVFTAVFGSAATTPPDKPHGLRMNGDYKATDGMDLSFSDGRTGVSGVADYGMSVTLSGCGKLAPQDIGYTMMPRGNGYILQLATNPKPIVLAFGPGGQLVGPGVAQVAGQVIIGYDIVSQSKRYGDGNIVPGSVSTERVPVYGPATASCSFGAFQVFPQTYTKPDATGAALVGMSDLAGKPVPTGALISGVYAAAGGLRVEFSVDDVVVDCGEAHAKKAYTLQNSGDGVAIAVANDKPFTLVLKPDGSLMGSGAVTIIGRLLTGQDAGGNYTFKPVTATCNVGTLPQN